MVVDTSALIAILLNEPERERFAVSIVEAPVVRLSAAAIVELAIVLTNKKEEQVLSRVDRFLESQNIRIEAVSLAQSMLAREAFRTYGKGRHPAALNFGDCFAYALAKATGEPLLYKGSDFAQTDVASAL